MFLRTPLECGNMFLRTPLECGNMFPHKFCMASCCHTPKSLRLESPIVHPFIIESGGVGVSLTGITTDSSGGADSAVIVSGDSLLLDIDPAPAAISPGDLVVTEIMFNPSFDTDAAGGVG